jgi:hypothetical protein
VLHPLSSITILSWITKGWKGNGAEWVANTCFKVWLLCLEIILWPGVQNWTIIIKSFTIFATDNATVFQYIRLTSDFVVCTTIKFCTWCLKSKYLLLFNLFMHSMSIIEKKVQIQFIHIYKTFLINESVTATTSHCELLQ